MLDVHLSPNRWELDKVYDELKESKQIWVCGPPLMNEEFKRKFGSYKTMTIF